jgi:regulator of protease activity HflC (stomatin/prohibitin superfamily)
VIDAAAQHNARTDLQTVTLDLRVLYSADKNKLPQLYREVGGSEDEPGLLSFDNMVLPSVVVESLKGVVASFDADKLVTEREAVSRLIKSTLQSRARQFGIQIDDIAITQFHFSRMYEQAVERKQIAQQNAQRAQFYVLKVRRIPSHTSVTCIYLCSRASVIACACLSAVYCYMRLRVRGW